MKRIVLILFLSIPLLSQASHYMGGEIYWQCLMNGRYRFIMKLYRECNGITYAPTETITVTNCPGINSITMNLFPGGNPNDINDGTLDGKTTITPHCYDPLQELTCYPAPPVANTGAVEQWYYTSDLTYPSGIQINGVPPAAGWIFSYSSCCRNPSTNLVNATSANWYLYAIMYPFNGMNANPCYDNSPISAEPPTPATCAGSPSVVSFHIEDVDGDSLSFEWSPAMQALTAPMTYASGYSYSSPLPGPAQNPLNTPAVMNSNLGEITFWSYTQGAFCLSQKVSAYRNGIKISENYSEFQMVILPCSGTNQTPELSGFFFNPVSGAYDQMTDTVNAGDLVNTFVIVSDTALLPNSNFQTISLQAYGEYLGTDGIDPLSGCPDPPCAFLDDTLPITQTYVLSTQFQWQTAAGQLSQEFLMNPASFYSAPFYYIPFNFDFYVHDDYCPVPASADYTMRIYVRTDTLQPNPILACIGQDDNDHPVLNWMVPDGTANHFYGYEILRSSTGPGTGIPVDTVFDFYTQTYTDVSVVLNNTKYYYCLRTLSDVGFITSPPGTSNEDSIHSMTLSLILGPPAVIELSIAGITLPDGNVYYLYADCDGMGWSLLDSSSTGQFQTSAIDSSSTCYLAVWDLQDTCLRTSNELYFDYSGLQERASSVFLIANPNPTAGQVTLRWVSGELPMQIQLTNVLGECVGRWEMSSRSLSIDVSLLPDGMYYLGVAGRSGTIKLVIRHG